MKPTPHFCNGKSSYFLDTVNLVNHYNHLLHAKPSISLEEPFSLPKRKALQRDPQVYQQNKRLVNRLKEILGRKPRYSEDKPKLCRKSRFREEEAAITIYRANGNLLERIQRAKSSRPRQKPVLSSVRKSQANQLELDRSIQRGYYQVRKGQQQSREEWLGKLISKARKRVRRAKSLEEG